jgi:hypothetical protein
MVSVSVCRDDFTGTDPVSRNQNWKVGVYLLVVLFVAGD